MTSSPWDEYYKQQKQQLHCEEYRHNVIHSPFTKFHKKIMHILPNLTQQNPEKFLKNTLKKNTLSHVEKQMHGRSYSYKVHKINDWSHHIMASSSIVERGKQQQRSRYKKHTYNNWCGHFVKVHYKRNTYTT